MPQAEYISTFNGKKIYAERAERTKESGLDIDATLAGLHQVGPLIAGDGIKLEDGASGVRISAYGPTGACGPRGATGNAGSTGPCGPKGACGPVGYCGPRGAGGNYGATGPCGPLGFCGPKGWLSSVDWPTQTPYADTLAWKPTTAGQVVYRWSANSTRGVICLYNLYTSTSAVFTIDVTFRDKTAGKEQTFTAEIDKANSKEFWGVLFVEPGRAYEVFVKLSSGTANTLTIESQYVLFNG